MDGDSERSAHAPTWDNREDPFLAEHLRGSGGHMRQLREEIAPLNAEPNRDLVRVILITGESGSGKNHVAKVIAAHRVWLREAASRDAEFAVNLDSFSQRYAEIPLPTLPDQLVESELFGHVKGAFTGADMRKRGLLDEGMDDVLLDEVGDASLVVQAKLLRVIETRQFRPLGGSLEDESETGSRLLLATHRDLAARVRTGDFREDLYWRASQFRIRVPALREQPENIPMLIDYQLAYVLATAGISANPAERLREPPALTESDKDWAGSYKWPGNLRQLRHALARWLVNGGRRSLRTIALDAEDAILSLRESEAGPGDAIEEYIRRGLDLARRDNRPAAQSLGHFLDGIQRAAEAAVVRWHDDRKLTSDEIAGLFPGMKRTSIASKLSQWRTRR